MRTHLECIPCFIKQSLEAACMATDDEKNQTEVLKAVMKYFQNVSLTNLFMKLGYLVANAIINRPNDYLNIKLKDIPGFKNIGLIKLKKEDLDFSKLDELFNKIRSNNG